jgi:hypothetical protein
MVLPMKITRYIFDSFYELINFLSKVLQKNCWWNASFQKALDNVRSINPVMSYSEREEIWHKLASISKVFSSSSDSSSNNKLLLFLPHFLIHSIQSHLLTHLGLCILCQKLWVCCLFIFFTLM